MLKNIMVSAFALSLATTTAFAAGKAEKKAAAGDECSFHITGNDAMKYGIIDHGAEAPLTELKIPEKCKKQDIHFTLEHVGKLPKEAMGHNFVIADATKQPTIIADGLKAGLAKSYIPDNGDGIVGHTSVVGGGEKSDLTIKKGSFKDGVNYSFFCTFPGHAAVMNGKVNFVK